MWQKQCDITLTLSEAMTRSCNNGTDYEPKSLRTMLAALDRYFHGSGCRYSISKDKEFLESRKVLNGKATELREQGKREVKD